MDEKKVMKDSSGIEIDVWVEADDAPDEFALDHANGGTTSVCARCDGTGIFEGKPCFSCGGTGWRR